MEYKRWEWFMEQRVFPSGKFPNIDMIQHDYQTFRDKESALTNNNGGLNKTASNNWTNLSSPKMPVAAYGGMGRINCMAFMPGNSNTIFIGAACGGVWKSTNAGQTWAVLNTDQLPSISITSICIDPINTNNIYLATGCASGLKKSTVGGLQGSYVNKTAGILTLINAFDVSKADTNYQYASTNDSMIMTTNNGTNWTYITPGLPVNSASISYITCSTSDPNKVWVTFSGYSAGNKVFMSNNGGITWVNYSGTLPNVPVNCMVYVDGSNDDLYIGTDFGVFYRNATSLDWTSFNTDLPNVIVGHLDIQYSAMKLRAGTFGRGLWEIDLPSPQTLPVELLNFAGKYNEIEKCNSLTWQTTSETNNQYFELMKSADSKSFSSIGRINSTENPAQLNEYLFEDCHFLNETNYYYLKQIEAAMQISTDVNNSVDISFLNSGVYFLKLTNTNQNHSFYGQFMKK